MVWPYVASALVGALLVQQKLPETKVKKLAAIGPKTGNHYRVEDFRGTTMIVVRRGQTTVTLGRNPNALGYHFIAARKTSDPEVVNQICLDFCTPRD